MIGNLWAWSQIMSNYMGPYIGKHYFAKKLQSRYSDRKEIVLFMEAISNTFAASEELYPWLSEDQ